MKFRRASTKNRKEVRSSWRRPRGTHNKQTRERNKGAMPSAGYGSPVAKRNKIQGKDIILVSNVKALDEKKACIIAKVGSKRRKEILEEAKKKGVLVVNYDIEKELQKITQRVDDKKKAKAKKVKAAKEEKKDEKKDDKKTVEEQKEDDQKKAEKLVTKAR
ncbi:hypothetical protein CMO91_02230 [Candidatus Woesearchaeota archaeon]|mgnify:CR=1 FL=1|nr:hypothetical protein [Candidatus Woesearchaeota archaeon]|tara:strand:+ start:485 stop:967 length:483 start_codon:yes stop_codon:yes gene_type:complete